MVWGAAEATGTGVVLMAGQILGRPDHRKESTLWPRDRADLNGEGTHPVRRLDFKLT